MSILNLGELGQSGHFRKNAVMLALLPYGIVSKKALGMLFPHPEACSACIVSLKKQRLVEEHSLTVRSRKSYKVAYLTLTLDGLNYLAEEFYKVMPWLIELLLSYSGESFSVRGRMNNEGLERLLRSHSASIVFSLASQETLFERLINRPNLEATMMEADGVSLPFYRRIAKLLENNRESCTKPSGFFDFMEIRALERVQRSVKVADSVTMLNSHIGIYRNEQTAYIVYASQRYGAKWDESILRRSSYELLRQIQSVGGKEHLYVPSCGYPSIMLCFSEREWQRAYLDPYHLRSKRNQTLGTGAARLHLIPTTSQGIKLLGFLLKDQAFERNMGFSLRKRYPELKYDGLNLDFPYLYQSVPCTLGYTMDITNLNLCEDGEEQGIICWKWQMEYYRTLFPKVTFFVAGKSCDRMKKFSPMADWTNKKLSFF